MVFGFGVVARVRLDGTLVWARWLGPKKGLMNGFDRGRAASAVWADGTVVLGWNQLLGIDPADGSVRWEGPTWRDYGTPAVVGGLVATPAGELVRARDGEVLHEGLASSWFNGPVSDGSVVVWVGRREEGEGDHLNHARAWRVQGEAVSSLFDVVLDTRERIYASPTLVGDQILVVSQKGRLFRLDRRTGVVRSMVHLAAGRPGEALASPVVAGGEVLVPLSHGETIVVGVSSDEIIAVNSAVATRATPALSADQVWLHDGSWLRCHPR